MFLSIKIAVIVGGINSKIDRSNTSVSGDDSSSDTVSVSNDETLPAEATSANIPDDLDISEPVAEPDIEIIDVSDYQPPRIPSKSWRSPR